MAVNDSYAKSADSLADAGELVVDGSGAETGAVNITELGGGGACSVYRETDPAGDGSWAVSVLMDDTGNNWHSQLNGLVCSQSQSVRVRVVNESGGAIDVYAAGYEVDD